MSDNFEVKFIDYNFKPFINNNLTKIGFYKPTKVQQVVLPLALDGGSLVVESATGSGKTHAFLLPILQNIDEFVKEVQAIIIAPTRELASQLYQVLLELLVDTNIIADNVIGGQDRENAVKRYQKQQPQIVIGTIGRITDLVINYNVLKIHKAKTVVIDEADMIFETKELIEVDQIIGKIQDKPQFLVFSATIPAGLRQFLRKYLNNIQTIVIKEANLTTKNIEHLMIQCKAKNKIEILLDLLKIINPYLVIIFVNKKEGVDQLAKILAEQGLKIGKLHGDMDDRIRRQMIKRIQAGDYQYVIASDIAARGIDITGVSHVINYELPNDVEFYIHRTGRTARFTNLGVAYSLYAYEDDQYIKILQDKGLKPQFVKIQNGELVPTKLRKIQVESSSKKIEYQLHAKIPLPTKVKPGYRKKRNEEIKRQIKKAKKAQINESYRKRAQKKQKEENNI